MRVTPNQLTALLLYVESPVKRLTGRIPSGRREATLQDQRGDIHWVFLLGIMRVFTLIKSMKKQDNNGRSLFSAANDIRNRSGLRCSAKSLQSPKHVDLLGCGDFNPTSQLL